MTVGRTARQAGSAGTGTPTPTTASLSRAEQLQRLEQCSRNELLSLREAMPAPDTHEDWLATRIGWDLDTP